jgi:hypothetical protein
MFFNGVLTETVAELLNNELRIWEKTRREAERVTNLGKDPAGSRSTGPSWSQGVGRWPLRGNQEAPSQPGGHARCASRNTAFVRAPWVGPPNRASPMRGFVIALGKLRAVRGVCRSSRLDRASPMRAFVIARGTRCAAVGSCGSGRQTGLRPCVPSSSFSERAERRASVLVLAARLADSTLVDHGENRGAFQALTCPMWVRLSGNVALQRGLGAAGVSQPDAVSAAQR